MKKFFLSIVLALLSMTAHAEVWYYIQSGKSPESDEGFAYVLVRDNSGQLWLAFQEVYVLKNNLLKNRDYYVDAFNRGSHQTFEWLTNRFVYDEHHIYCGGTRTFSRYALLERTAKCYIMKTTDGINSSFALGLDYKTLIFRYDSVNPVYYTSIPVDRLIVRKSVDDLF